MTFIIAEMKPARSFTLIKHFSFTTTYPRILLLLAVLVVSGCAEEKQNRQAAPAGDKVVLEKLAASYNRVAETMQVSPSTLNPAGTRKFVEMVFNDAGYDYHATLMMLSGNTLDPAIQYHRDLAELVLLPQKGLSYDDLSSVFEKQESEAISKILIRLRRGK